MNEKEQKVADKLLERASVANEYPSLNSFMDAYETLIRASRNRRDAERDDELFRNAQNSEQPDSQG